MEQSFQNIAAVFRYDRDRLVRWMRAGKGKRYRLYIIILTILAVNFLIAIPSAEQKAMPGALIVVCLAAMALVFFRARRADKGMTTVDELYNGGEEYRVFLKADGLRYQSAGKEDAASYDSCTEVCETDECFRLCYGEKKLFLLPKEALGDGQAAAFSHFLSERFGKSYRYIG